MANPAGDKPVTLVQFAESQKSDYLKSAAKLASSKRDVHLADAAFILLFVGAMVSIMALRTIRAYNLPHFSQTERIVMASVTGVFGGTTLGLVIRNVVLAIREHRKTNKPLTDEDKQELLAQEVQFYSNAVVNAQNRLVTAQSQHLDAQQQYYAVLSRQGMDGLYST